MRPSAIAPIVALLALAPGLALAQAGPAPAAPPASAAPASSAPASAAPPPAGFAYDPPGSAHATGGKGFSDVSVFVPGMRFPIEQPKAFANSQVWGHGGSSGPGGGQCDAQNYAYPWHDNFCEARAYKTPMCPAGNGHQGQDIRPSSCVKAHWLAVAAEAGRITQIGSYTVYLTADDGRMFRYLHLQMDQLKVRIGDRVERGQPIGYVSNNFGKTPTTIHLHFEVKEPVTRDGKSLFTFVPPYSSLVDAYQRLLAGAP
jgi:murein DD-endopeptidase MepM/ murein hydrolase activator NlpD